MTEDEPCPIRCVKTSFILPNNFSPFPHDDGYRARQDVRANHGSKDHTLCPGRKSTARERRDRCFRPFRAPQSPKSVTGACSSPCRVVGAAFSSGTRNPTKIYDNRYAPKRDLLSPLTTGIPSPRYGPRGAVPASRPPWSTKTEDFGHDATPDPDPASLRRRLIGTRRRVEQGWGRLISQNNCTTAHTLHRVAFCNQPDILQRHRQYCRRLSSFALIRMKNQAG